jgi:hypothetical protein
MKCLVFAILLTLVVLVGEALAGCVTSTIFLPDGTMQICTICCAGSSCTTTCF